MLSKSQSYNNDQINRQKESDLFGGLGKSNSSNSSGTISHSHQSHLETKFVDTNLGFISKDDKLNSLQSQLSSAFDSKSNGISNFNNQSQISFNNNPFQYNSNNNGNQMMNNNGGSYYGGQMNMGYNNNGGFAPNINILQPNINVQNTYYNNYQMQNSGNDFKSQEGNKKLVLNYDKTDMTSTIKNKIGGSQNSNINFDLNINSSNHNSYSSNSNKSNKKDDPFKNLVQFK